MTVLYIHRAAQALKFPMILFPDANIQVSVLSYDYSFDRLQCNNRYGVSLAFVSVSCEISISAVIQLNVTIWECQDSSECLAE